jgi:hypothetical protein
MIHDFRSGHFAEKEDVFSETISGDFAEMI